MNIQQQALRDLEQAFANFFAGRAGSPTPRHKGLHETFRFPAIHCGKLEKVNAKWSRIRLPKLGDVKLRTHRPLEGRPLSITVAQEAGAWFVSIVCEVERADPPAPKAAVVGINRGVAQTLTLSTGGVLAIDRERLDVLDRQARKAQRRMSRRRPKPGQKGSRRYRQAKTQAARARVQATRYRRDWQHKAALNIASRFGVVTLEALKIQNMTASAAGMVEALGSDVKQKAGLNPSILDEGWFGFELALGYKLEERGGLLVQVPATDNSHTCAECGVVHANSRRSQSQFGYVECGHAANADHNAARVILNRGQSAGVERPVTASMKREAKARKSPKTPPLGEAQLSRTRMEEPATGLPEPRKRKSGGRIVA